MKLTPFLAGWGTIPPIMAKRKPRKSAAKRKKGLGREGILPKGDEILMITASEFPNTGECMILQILLLQTRGTSLLRSDREMPLLVLILVVSTLVQIFLFFAFGALYISH